MAENSEYPVLAKNDEDLLQEIFSLLQAGIQANAYGVNGAFAAEISRLPIGLRAMAATHWLDVSLSMDDIGWHFGNFGEPNFVRETEGGLHELGLGDAAAWFREAYAIFQRFLDSVGPREVEMAKSDPSAAGNIYSNWLKSSGNQKRIDELSQLAWDKNTGSSENAAAGSFIYESWIKYARLKPQNVFAAQKPN